MGRSPETQQSWPAGSEHPLVRATELPRSEPARNWVGVTVGSYRIIRQLGQGGCGSVWLAEHDVIGTKVAIKILRPEVVNIPGVHERFITEARASSTIPSSHVARYTDMGQLPTGEPYAVMEYLEGETVHARIHRSTRLSIKDAVEITRQAAETLALAHDASIIHRDIKPENIFLVGEPGTINIKVLDFGIAKLVGDAMQSSHQTATGAFVGTPAYCAPEQLLATGTTIAVDMYALGTTLFEMLTGRLPFDTANPEFLVMKVSDDPPRVRELRPEVSERLDALVAAMVAASPGARPASMRELVSELNRIDVPLPQPSADAKPRRRAVPIIVGTLAALVAIGGAVVLMRDNVSPAPARVEPVAAPAAIPIDAMPVPPAPAVIVESAPPSDASVPTTTKRPIRRAKQRPAPTAGSATHGKDVIMADPFEE